MDLGLRGKRALVMGASKGLGRAVADSLAAEGVALVVSGRDQGRLDVVAAELLAQGAAAAHGVPADVASGDDIDRLGDAAVRLLGGVDILVLNHGGPPPGGALDITEAQLIEWFPKIVLHPMRLAMKLLPAMRAQKFGRIITVGSTGMVQPIPNLALSTILRAAMVGWNKTLSGDVAADGVTCNIVAPGTILTDRQRETSTDIATKRSISIEQVMEERAAGIPAKRMGAAAEFGPMVAFLASVHSAYTTGLIVRVDGGIVRAI